MRLKGTAPWTRLSRQDVERLVLFFDPDKNAHLNNLQTEGCFRLWNTLCDDSLRFAYLADEVGMGKTYQALGVIGLLYYMKPGARIVILCPGKEMQKQWSSDWHSFFKDKFCPSGIDGFLKSFRVDANGVQGFESSVQPLVCENLNQFAVSMIASQHFAYLLRYPSFSLPVRVFEWEAFRHDRGREVAINSLLEDFCQRMDEIGCIVDEQELEEVRKSAPESLNYEDASSLFLGWYARSVASLVNVFSPDLVIWDEAQYLRTDATRNDMMRTIFGSLHQAGCRHLFLSATPAHREVADINQLNHLLVDPKFHERKLIDVRQEGEHADAFRQSVSRWMVRRERSYVGKGKLEYRDFRDVPIDMFATDQSPLYALTFAAMQKKLVLLLAGQNNKFRMGEISCNESSRASIEGASLRKGEKSEADEISEVGTSVLEESSGKGKGDPVDENYLLGLGNRFKAIQKTGVNEVARQLPHAKVDHVIGELARDCLDHGSCTKELVFVRRVATVDELADGLLHEFQRILNVRIKALGEEPETYWKLPPDASDESDESDVVESGEVVDSLGPVNELSYFKAISAVKGSLGRLTKYRNSLGKPETSTIRFLFLTEKEMSDDDREKWRTFLCALGISMDDAAYRPFREDSNKALLLRRCIGHSLRFTEILVDLDVLRRKDRKGYVDLWVQMLAKPPNQLRTYFENTRIKLSGWIHHFETIVNKCFKGSGFHNSYLDIAERVATYFRGLSPVARRSGRRTDENVVSQFKFPVSPNILICTDVLREGVNLHLFCERISHYGVAWNSGDLEQRIGRVERADSLFERNIQKNSEHRLPVIFPFLSRTLDDRQVKKVIRRKREIDALFSIVPPRETGEITDSKEEGDGRPAVHRTIEPFLPPMSEPDSVGAGWLEANASTLATWSRALLKAHELVNTMSTLDLQGFNYHSCRMLGELGLLAIEWDRLAGPKKTPDWRVCDKLILDTFERRKQWKTIRTLYVPIAQELTSDIVLAFWANAATGLSGTRADLTNDGFSYCSDRNSHIRKHQIEHPVEKYLARTQLSYRCRWGSGFALASFVGNLANEQVADSSAELLASDINKSLPFGCASIMDGQLIVLFPQAPGVVWDTATDEKVADRLALWADRHQWVFMKGEDDNNILQRLPVSGISDMNTNEAIAVIRSVGKWCDELNQAIGSEIAESISWRMSTFDRMVKTGTFSSASEIVPRPGIGKFQIAYTVTGLTEVSGEKNVVIYLSAKPANVRVVSNDMVDIWDFLSRNGSYETWAGDGCNVEISGTDFHYSYYEHTDGKQYRRLRLVLSAADLQSNGGRTVFVPYLAKLASQQLLNDVFQYNAAKTRLDGYKASI